MRRLFFSESSILCTLADRRSMPPDLIAQWQQKALSITPVLIIILISRLINVPHTKTWRITGALVLTSTFFSSACYACFQFTKQAHHIHQYATFKPERYSAPVLLTFQICVPICVYNFFFYWKALKPYHIMSSFNACRKKRLASQTSQIFSKLQ